MILVYVISNKQLYIIIYNSFKSYFPYHAYLGPLEGLDGLRYSREEDMGCSGCPPRLPPPPWKGVGRRPCGWIWKILSWQTRHLQYAWRFLCCDVSSQRGGRPGGAGGEVWRVVEGGLRAQSGSEFHWFPPTIPPFRLGPRGEGLDLFPLGPGGLVGLGSGGTILLGGVGVGGAGRGGWVLERLGGWARAGLWGAGEPMGG